MRLALLVFALVLVSCSGSAEEPTLRLGGVEVPEEQYRSELRVTLAEDTRICPGIRGLSTEEVLAWMGELPAVALEGVSEDDNRRVAEMIREECERINN